jgi:phage tail sheath protein FI
MPQYLAPGVYVEEVSSGPPPIEGVGTNTAGFVGATRRGPVEGPPTLVTSYAEFVRAFGGPFDLPGFAGWRDLPSAIRGFFDNGGQRAYVARVAAASAAGDTAAITLKGGFNTRLAEDTSTDAAGNANKRATLVSLRGITVGTKLILRMTRRGVTTDSAALTITTVNRDTGVVELNNAISTTTIFEAANTVVITDRAKAALTADGQPDPLANPTDAKPDSFKLTASSSGTWGRDVRVAPAAQSAARSVAVALLSGAADDNRVELLSGAGFYVNAWVEIDLGTSKRYRKVLAVDGPVLKLSGPALTAADVVPAAGGARIATCEFALEISYTDPVELVSVTERFSGLTLENIPGRFYRDQMASSALVVADVPPASTHPLLFPSAADGIADRLAGGADNVPTPADVVGHDLGPNRKSGLRAIEEVDEVAILAAPGLVAQPVQNALISQCERLMDRFAVLDPVAGSGGAPATLAQIQAQRDLYDSKYAALYYPRVLVDDPLMPGTTRPLAPSGHILGVYSRVDAARGVHKAPANEVVRGITDLETSVSKGAQEILNPRNINVIRDLRSMQRGLRNYGARCVTGESEWNYVNVRRLFIFLEESLDEGTQWVVFEPNDRKLWARVQQSVSLFLTRVWVDGALMGDRPEDAFFVRVDETTMTEDDILNGRLIMEIGIAPVRPAEFVVIRIGQWLGGSSVQEI